MKGIWNKIDVFLGKVVVWLSVAIIISIFFALNYKVISGKYMMYENYYDKNSQSQQFK